MKRKKNINKWKARIKWNSIVFSWKNDGNFSLFFFFATERNSEKNCGQNHMNSMLNTCSATISKWLFENCIVFCNDIVYSCFVFSFSGYYTHSKLLKRQKIAHMFAPIVQFSVHWAHNFLPHFFSRPRDVNFQFEQIKQLAKGFNI